MRAAQLLVQLFVTLLVTLLSVSVSGCFEPDHSLIPPAQPVSITSGLAPGDRLEIRVYGEDSISGAFQVQQNGSIDFPLIGRLEVLGMTQGELAETLERKLRDGYLRHPQVTVIMTARENLEVSVLGEVTRPGTFSFIEQLTLVQAISDAGGLTELAQARRVKLTRKGPLGPATYEVSVKAITEGRATDILLQPGDIIFVPLAPI